LAIPGLAAPGLATTPTVQRPTLVNNGLSLLAPTARAFGDGRLLQGRLNPSGGLTPGQQCRRAIANAERLAGIPPHLLSAIARIESGRRDPETGAIDPWPWSINVEGVDHVYQTKAEVIAAVQNFLATGHHSIDVGCMQVNLMFHPNAFASLDQAFDPKTNAEYAAKFLTQLYHETGTWEHATANYHSATPEIGAPYERKVIAALPDEQRVESGGNGGLPGLQRMAQFIMPSATMTTPYSTYPVSPGTPALAMRRGMGLPNGAPIGPPATGAPVMIGRTLDSYRSSPITLARR
jgi:hypothetical protein